MPARDVSCYTCILNGSTSTTAVATAITTTITIAAFFNYPDEKLVGDRNKQNSVWKAILCSVDTGMNTVKQRILCHQQILIGRVAID